MQGRAYYHKPSHQGWLIVIGNVQDNAEYSVANSNLDDCFLWNPVSSETIRLPNIDRQSFSTKSKQYFLYDLVLSSPPLQSTTTDPDNLGCVVYLLFNRVNHPKAHEDKHVLAFCRPGDKQWRTKVLSFTAPGNDRKILSIESLLCFRGKLYAFCKNSLERGWVIQIEIQKLWHYAEAHHQTPYVYVTIIKLEHADFTWIGGGEEFSRYMEFWVESGNEIFKVHFNCSPRGFRKVSSTHIFKLDFSSMTWILVKSLDDHAPCWKKEKNNRSFSKSRYS
ncbi:hypothetical protein MKX03_019787 [Papaver bracteatum]|nr:hypothetical protein MKX03_019787 [Papaver bracteatum]